MVYLLPLGRSTYCMILGRRRGRYIAVFGEQRACLFKLFMRVGVVRACSGGDIAKSNATKCIRLLVCG